MALNTAQNFRSETIYSLATAFGKAGIATFRISGPNALRAFYDIAPSKCATKKLHCPPKPRYAIYTAIIDSKGHHIDDAVIIYFKAPNSFTGEEVLEISTHGSIAVINKLLKLLSNLSYLRLATPGEYAKRAFLNQKMDLTQAEGIADLIEAETDFEHRIATQQMLGKYGEFYEAWRSKIINSSASLEALIDYPEEDIPQEILDEVEANITMLANEIATYLQKQEESKSLMDGINIAIVGPPNVGKSSLINALIKQDVAIVSNIAGTTRDVLSHKISLNGFPVVLQDTAGLRETNDTIEKEGIKRAYKAMQNANIVIELSEGPNAIFTVHNEVHCKNSSASSTNKYIIKVLTKADLHNYKNRDELCISINNYSTLLNEISHYLENKLDPSSIYITRQRHWDELNLCKEILQKFKITKALEMNAEELRQASECMGRITGRAISVDDVLDQVFSNFCLGK